MYVEIDCNKYSGYEIQDAADSKSEIMTRMGMMKTVVEAENNSVLLYLVEPWANTDRIFCGYRYFESIGAAETLKKIGM